MSGLRRPVANCEPPKGLGAGAQCEFPQGHRTFVFFSARVALSRLGIVLDDRRAACDGEAERILIVHSDKGKDQRDDCCCGNRQDDVRQTDLPFFEHREETVLPLARRFERFGGAGEFGADGAEFGLGRGQRLPRLHGGKIGLSALDARNVSFVAGGIWIQHLAITLEASGYAHHLKTRCFEAYSGVNDRLS